MPHDLKSGVVAAAFSLGLLSAPPADAAQTGAFTLTVGGFKVGILAYEATETADRYEVHGSARSAGLIGAFMDGNVDAAVSGRIRNGTLLPSVSKETTVSGGQTVQRIFDFSKGFPAITRTPPRTKPQKYAVPAEQQAGTLDPLSAAYAILRDKPAAEVCKLDVIMFDGARRSRLQMTGGTASPGGMVCDAVYTRVAGFSPREMREQSTWPVTLTYAANGTGYRLSELNFPSSFGNARLRRQ